MEPGSGSSAPYGGSRTRKQRYEYSETSRAGFAELSPAFVMTGKQLFNKLSKVSGVKEVRWATPKSAQGNVSAGHYMEQNVLVYSSMGGSGSAKRPMEFEITRHQHLKGSSVPYTVTVMFKDLPQDMEAEAWRILMAVVKGKELLPEHVRNYMHGSLARHSGGEGGARRTGHI